MSAFHNPEHARAFEAQRPLPVERALTKEAAAANALRQSLQAITDDPEAIRDTIEGETNLHDAIAAVMDAIRDDEASVLGLVAMIEKLKDRKTRIEERMDRRRTAIEQAMCIGELRSLELPDATLFLRNVAPAVEITDESRIPAQFWKPRDPTLDKSALKDALQNGSQIPGAVLGNGGISLTIRRA